MHFLRKGFFPRIKRYFPAFLIAGFLVSCNSAHRKTSVSVESLQGVEPRNVIFILSDDHRYDYMGFTGKLSWLETPAMDRMAGEGAYFPNAFVTTSLCSPSRASILTGQFSHTHKVVDNQAPAPKENIYFPQYLQTKGYQTAFLGKWHMGGETDEPRPGFDHWESFRGQGVYYNPTLNINGEHKTYGDSTYITDLLTEHAIEWLENRDEEKPFFMYLSHKAVHGLYEPAQRHLGKYENVELELPPSFYTSARPVKGKDHPNGYHQYLGPDKDKIEHPAPGDSYYGEGRTPDWQKMQRESWHGVDYMYHAQHVNYETLVKRYCEQILSLDESIGSVLDYLDAKGLGESTVVIYMGDNGFAFGEHGLIDKRHFYEESAKVPFLMRCPEIVKEKLVNTRMIQNIDVAPTILELAGIKKPEQMQGRSFLPLLTEENPEWRDKIFYEYYWENNFPQTPTMHGVRTDRYKYIRYHGIWDTNEFYDLKEDPFEMNNLIASPQHQPIIKELSDEIYSWLESTGGMQIPLKRTTIRLGDHRNNGLY
ncbi:Arylsulfatase A [Mariniphaga anaerophila]|uniref:Arylsulfatase A n=1 Tax=Mariniphaga anaerophila TaxID=1484053 RepID=A0A1M5GCZ8_9BACT|nr:sulfatase [Mariniphaga anaerophila]SHG01549.1 Arylsulfatase A [Mariniphaga anaerophila]